MAEKKTRKPSVARWGMKNNWIRIIAKSDGISGAVDAAHAEARTALEKRINTRKSAREFKNTIKNFRGHYASTWKIGRAGKTWVIRAKSPMARKRTAEGLTLMRRQKNLFEKQK